MHHQEYSSAPKSGRSARSGMLTATIMVWFAAWLPLALSDRTTRSDELLPPASRSESPAAKTPPSPPVTAKPDLLHAPFNKSAAQAAQAAWSKHLGQPATRTNSLGMKLMLVPPGEYQMGSGETADATAQFTRSKGYDDAKADKFENEHPRHRVRITEPFYLGQYEVTVKDFRTFLAESNYKTDPDPARDWDWSWLLQPENSEIRKRMTVIDGFALRDEHPILFVTWNEATAFCEWLSKKEHAQYRLPTETEWEYACRAGTTGRYQTGDDPEALSRVGNVADKTLKEAGFFTAWTIDAEDGYVCLAPPGRFAPNAFGLYDMHGNAWEWCADLYKIDYYGASVVDNPQGPDPDVPRSRVNRGGSWAEPPWNCRSASRWWGSRTNRTDTVGFRVARVP